MAGRPRSVSDAAILDAAARAILRIGPGRLTLADVAAEVGLAPATLVQRFGSKRGLLLAYAERSAATIRARLREARTPDRSPLAALVEGLVHIARPLATPEALANSMGVLMLDVTDEEFHRHARAHTYATRDEIRALLDEAVQAGELAPTVDTARLALAVHNAYTGVIGLWALDREGALADRIRDEVSFLLAPFRTPAG